MKNNKKADLHIHSAASDGSFYPEEIIEVAKKEELSCISITDHDTLESVTSAKEIGEKRGVEVISGVEISTEKQEKELHILGYFLDEDNPQLIEYFNNKCEKRKLRVDKILGQLNDYGVKIEKADLKPSKYNKALGRLHIAKALIDKGYAKNVKQAFRNFLLQGKPGAVSGFHTTAEEAIDIIRQFHGIPVLAHPGIAFADSFIKELQRNGLMGIEVFHPDHSLQMSNHYLQFAKKNGLFVTGGSDCHGLAKRNVYMGKFTLDYEYVEQLKEAKAKQG